MSLLNKCVLFVCFVLWTHAAWSEESSVEQEKSRPSMSEIKEAVRLAPVVYQKDVLAALRRSGRNGRELIQALKKADLRQREGMAFLIANMPGRDLVSLKGDFLVRNIQLSYQALNVAPWGKDIPQDVFLNNVLPYASLNERRDVWRADFYKRFINIALTSKSIDQTVKALNKYVFDSLQVSYSADRRPKPDQSPYESIAAHYASCTGLSILLVDALRSVGVPARIAGVAMWPDGSGNHTWVEIWDGQWHFIGAAEPTALDQTWFASKASQIDASHPIYAVSFQKTRLIFPMRWAPTLRFVSAIDVSKHYKL